MRDLKAIQHLQKGMDIEELTELVRSFTIQEKINFSHHLTKERLAAKLKDLRERQVPQRNVFLNAADEAVLSLWLKNFIHCDLEHWVYPAPKDKRGCSKEQLRKDAARDSLYFYENGQQNFDYTVKDIEDYIKDVENE